MKYEPKIELYFPEEIKSGLDRIQKVYKGWALEDVDIDKLLEGIDQAIEDNTKANTTDAIAIATDVDLDESDYKEAEAFYVDWDEEDEELPWYEEDEENDENICSSEDDYHLSELDDFDREDDTEVIRIPITETIIIESHGYRRR